MTQFMNQRTLTDLQLTRVFDTIQPHLERLMGYFGEEGDWTYDLLERVAIQENDDVFVGFRIDLDGIPMMMLPTSVDAVMRIVKMKHEVERLGYEVTPAMRLLDTDENKLAFGVVVLAK